MSGVDLNRAGDGLQGAVPEVVERLLVQVVLLLAQPLLEHLAFVSELDDRLGVGVEGGDGGGHAAGEGTPRHAGWRNGHGESQSQTATVLRFYSVFFWGGKDTPASYIIKANITHLLSYFKPFSVVFKLRLCSFSQKSQKPGLFSRK